MKLGGNPFFTQLRPGRIDPRTGKERIFKLIKLRTMTNEKDEHGELVPDDVRLIPYGKWLRSTSLDELFELVNILKGDMAIIGPRPQLVRDMVFMTSEQRKRHTVRPGLSGLAQVRGRNAISWDGKLSTDLEDHSRHGETSSEEVGNHHGRHGNRYGFWGCAAGGGTGE